MISPEIQSLRRDIEQRMGVALQSPADFEHLIQQIWDKQHSVLSLSTIKRIWGYVQSNGVPRLSTLNTLSQFLNYADWNAHLVALTKSVSEQVLVAARVACLWARAYAHPNCNRVNG